MRSIVFILCWLAAGIVDAGTLPTGLRLQETSVTVRAGRIEGSGTIFTRTIDGEQRTFVWTAAHVVRSLRSERKAVDQDGASLTIVEFGDAEIIKDLLESGRRVGELKMDAEVIRYSDEDTGDDIALLLVRKSGVIGSSTKFFDGKQPPEVGARVLHVGAFLGHLGAASIVNGIISQDGRVIGKRVYTQVSTPTFPGSSGGGVFLEDGRYIGMIQRGTGETFSLACPVRRVRACARRMNAEWAMDESVPAPGLDVIRAGPIEDTARNGSVDKSWKNSFPMLIRELGGQP